MTDRLYGFPDGAYDPEDLVPVEAGNDGSGRGSGRKLVSLVIPALNEAPGVAPFLLRYREYTTTHADLDFELVVIDDGSTDGTTDRFVELAVPTDRLTVVQLSRNFGAHYATSAGLAQCHGDCAVVFGADLQEPPELLATFLERWQSGYDVVWGVRRARVDGNFSYRMMARTFSWMFMRYTKLTTYPAQGPSGVLVDRKVLNELIPMRERHRNVLALIAWLGFSQTQVEFDLAPRSQGESRWTRRAMFNLAIDSLIQFSSVPMRLFSLVGLAIAGLGLLYATFLVLRAIVGVNTPSGWPTVMVGVLVLGGAQLMVGGVMGEYLWRAVEETRGRPLYVVRAVRTVGPAQQPRPDGTSVPASVQPSAPNGRPDRRVTPHPTV